MPPVPRYYHGSCPPHHIRSSLAGLTGGKGSFGSLTRPAQTSPQSPVLPQQHPITFIDAYGNPVAVNFPNSLFVVRTYATPNGEHPTDDVEAEEWGLFPQLSSIDAIVKGEERKRIRKDDGHHFGGYRPGKNTRQTPSIRSVGDTASKASRLFGLPVSELVSATLAFNELQKQREHEAWVKELMVTNSTYR